jgi:hypothetical protein
MEIWRQVSIDLHRIYVRVTPNHQRRAARADLANRKAVPMWEVARPRGVCQLERQFFGPAMRTVKHESRSHDTPIRNCIF